MAELLYHLRRKHPEWSGGKLANVHDQICGTFETGRVADYEIGSDLAVRDPEDAHVAAAARACGADVILTNNVKDFTPSDESPYAVMTPDKFLVLVDDADPANVTECIRQQITYWGHRTGDVDLPQMLRTAGCPEFANRVLQHVMQLAHQP